MDLRRLRLSPVWPVWPVSPAWPVSPLWLLLLATALAACGTTTTTVQCDPVCPVGSHCTTEGCVADVERDLAVEAPDLLATCSPACAGATPYCNPKSLCVPCLEDKQCPAGNVCKSLGQTSACVPGCTDDARCGGGAMKCCNGACADTSRETNNCGACGIVCAAPNSRAVCTAGQCTVAGCNAGWGDCNASAQDGCETNLRADAANCGTCGAGCKIANGLAGCADGCYLRACLFGFDDCDGNAANGCETTVLSDARNCGACGMACPLVAHAKNTCSNGACQLTSCDPGYADCDGNPVNGCEIGTVTDALNCGACGKRCAQGLICSQGLCTCPQCLLPNARSTCVNLQCAIASCNVNWGDCDGKAQNGCEQDLTSDARNCGTCGNVCAQGLVCTNGSCTCPNCVRDNAKTACRNNQCVLDSCFPGFGNCDGNDANGCETDLTSSAANCGACGAACVNPLPKCVASMCSAMPQFVGTFNVNQGPQWGGNPPCYTCQEACALVFGGQAAQYSCSTNMQVIDHKANTSIWGVGGCAVAAEDFKKSVNYNCGQANCAQSAYVTDNCGPGPNYCFK